MVEDSVAFLTEHDKRVFLDAEHFFDGFRDNPDFALRVLGAAEQAGRRGLVLCDTNGGSLPGDITDAVLRGARRDHRARARDPLPQRRRRAPWPTRSPPWRRA